MGTRCFSMWKKANLKDSIKLLNHWYISSVLELSPVFPFFFLSHNTSSTSLVWDVHTQEPFVPLAGHSLMMMMTYENKMFLRGHVCACVHRPSHSFIRSSIDHIHFAIRKSTFSWWFHSEKQNPLVLYIYAWEVRLADHTSVDRCIQQHLFSSNSNSNARTHTFTLSSSLSHRCKNRLCRIFLQVWQVPFPIWTTRIYIRVSIHLPLYGVFKVRRIGMRKAWKEEVQNLVRVPQGASNISFKHTSFILYVE